MAKKKAATKKAVNGQFPGMEEEVPEEVQDAVDVYDKALVAKSKASGKFNTAKQNAIDMMREHGVTRVRIRNGSKIMELTNTEKLILRKPEEQPGTGDETVFEKE